MHILIVFQNAYNKEINILIEQFTTSLILDSYGVFFSGVVINYF